MARSTSHRVRPALVLAALVTLAGCGGGDDTPDGAGGSDATTTTTTTATTATTDAAATDSETTTSIATTTTTTIAAAAAEAATATTPDTAAETTAPPTAPPTSAPAGASDCLVGEWVVTEAEMNAFYDAVEAGIDQPVDFTIVGEAGLVFTETTYAWAPAFTLQLELAGVTGSGEAGGSISGTYTTADNVLSTQLGESAMTLTIQVGGQTLDGSDIGNGFMTSVPFIDSPYSCDGPTPVIQFETTTDARHPVTLTPAG